MTKPKPPTNSPAFILYGLDANGQPRAASFSADQADLVTKAAESLKLKVVRIETPEQIELARELPPGQILAPGKGVVPTVRKELFDKLAGLRSPSPKRRRRPRRARHVLSVGCPPWRQTASEAPKPKRPPTNWAEIDVGDLVLAEDPERLVRGRGPRTDRRRRVQASVSGLSRRRRRGSPPQRLGLLSPA